MSTTFGERLKATRKEHRLSQTALAAACGWKQSIISMFETGERSPTLGSCAKLAQALDIPLVHLVTDPDSAMTHEEYMLIYCYRKTDPHYHQAVRDNVRAFSLLKAPS